MNINSSNPYNIIKRAYFAYQKCLFCDSKQALLKINQISVFRVSLTNVSCREEKR
ncbi:hypothetical protein HMPREF0653_00776 [Prevotella disiens JCM 6334 = ATCC 29426]|uniref:Uncharacterized protein n=1 Tax=Prevotella disiens JCM 6334 = ATCC 29426 TaxID=1235811 RepID=A0ABN0NTU2_9BACT|nr:hypothetical protein HMPREF0653_00776 [Prevotella disiens JCM 6334 = ATCC 29426]